MSGLTKNPLIGISSSFKDNFEHFANIGSSLNTFLQPEVFQVSVQEVKDKRYIVVLLKEQLENQWKQVIYN